MLKIISLAALLGTVTSVVMANPETLTTPAATSAGASTEMTSTSFTPAQKAEIDLMIWDSLKNNPEKLIQVLQKFTEDQQKEAVKKVQDSVNSAKDQLSDSKNAIVIGKADAAIKLVLFVDPNCPHCRVFELALGEIEKDLPNKEKLGVLIRQWPILGKNSEVVSAGLIAAYAQDSLKFKVLSDKLLSSEKAMDKEKFLNLAKEVGFDVVKLEAGIMSESVMNQLKNTKELAGKIGLEATPTIILTDKNGARLLQVGDKEELKKALIEAVKAS